MSIERFCNDMLGKYCIFFPSKPPSTPSPPSLLLLNGLYPKNDSKFAGEVSADARDMISGLLVKDPKARLPLSKLLDHPWIKNNASPNGIPQAEKDVAV